jgi:hypothetical protein
LKKIITYGIISLLLLAQYPLHAQRSGYQNRNSTAPLGYKIINERMTTFFPLAEVKKVNNTIYNSLKAGGFERSLYLVTCYSFAPVWQDLKALRDFAEEGNNVLIMACEFNKEAADFFNFLVTEEELPLPADFKKWPTDSIRLLQPVTRETGYHASNLLLTTRSFVLYDSARVTMLGLNGKDICNFIKVKAGRGAIYVHLLPEVFSNYFILEKKNAAYTASLLSYIPRNISTIYWKQPRRGASQYSGTDASEFSFLQFIWNDPDLRSVLILATVLFVLLLLFGFRRRQRIVPVIEPVENTTLEFARTMGDLYFNNRNNCTIAHKKIQYWQEYVRNRYNIPTRNMDGHFWELLTRKTGFETAFVKQLEQQVVRARNDADLKDRDLISLSNTIDQFYKK